LEALFPSAKLVAWIRLLWQPLDAVARALCVEVESVVDIGVGSGVGIVLVVESVVDIVVGRVVGRVVGIVVREVVPRLLFALLI
jgi:hypothetical protein